MLRTPLWSLLPLLLSCQTVAPAPVPAARPDARQILWQRSLEDALAQARAEGKPLLIALNMDGESASDRIVHELYRDPAFVAATRRCVCLVASVFRHNARDYDDQGRRIPCPRLGEVTCGEHMALEPVLFEKYLSDGERVAPRHALILPGGSKDWDLSLCFDLRDVQRALDGSLAALGEAAGSSTGAVDGSWDALAARRDQRGRQALEDAFLGAPDETAIGAGLDALARNGDAGSLGALRILAAELPGLPEGLRPRLLATTRALGLAAPLAGVLRTRLGAPGPALALDSPERGPLLAAAAALDGRSPATRTLILALRVLARHDSARDDASGTALEAAAAAAVASRTTALGGAFSLEDALRLAAEVTDAAPAGSLPRKGTIGDQMADAETLESELGELDARVNDEGAEPELLAQYAKALLDLARRRLEQGGPGARLLLQDAETWFARALDAAPGAAPARNAWWIERARTAYFLQHYADEGTYGRRAFALASGSEDERLPDERELALAAAGADEAPGVLADADAVEALRWIGDADARLLAARAGGDPAEEAGGLLEGLRALALVAASPYGDATDWTSFASFLGAVGLRREELVAAQEGARRLPAAPELRQLLNDTAWGCGRVDLSPVMADALVRASAPSGAPLWYAGYAWMLSAEDARRRELPELALLDYSEAAWRFERARALQPEYEASCRTYLGLSWMGRGLAHARAGRRAAAADALVEAMRTGAGLAGASDGLGYDALDLVDRICEWRESGPSPVDPLALLARLQELAPDDPYWANAISDSELREALRADGRNPERVERDTVDAGGNPIRMPMGLPTAEGDAYLRASIEAARRAPAGGAPPEPDVAPPLAQSDTIWAERMLQRGRLDGVREALAEAAGVMGLDPPAEDAGPDELRALAARLRSLLGEARPRLRLGR